MFRKLLISSIISTNIGYTLFLFPTLGMLYPNRVPLNLYNLAMFLLIDSFWGAILAIVIYFISRLSRLDIARASMLSILLLWILFWLLTISLSRNPIMIENIIVVFLDGIAAFITWIALLKFVKYYIYK